jgi:hemolysin D
MKSAKIIDLIPRMGANARRRDELAFLPAALEIVETPPSPVGRAIGGTVMLLFVVGIAWASFGKIDIVATAQGRIVPSGRVKVIQPMEAGVLRAVRVEDGQRVKAGDVLIEIDPTINEADFRQARRDLVAAQLDVARLRAALVESGDPIQAFRPPADASVEQVADQRRFLASQVGEHRARLAGLDKQRQQKEAETATIGATVGKLEAVLPVVQQRFDIRRTLHTSELGSKLQYLEMLQSLTEMQQELSVQKSHLRAAEAGVATIAETRAQVEAEYRRLLFDELGKQIQKENGLTEAVVKAEQRARLQVLKAPVDGTVQQLAVHTVGGVVTASQELMVVVPADSRLEVEAMLPNRDIGFVREDQLVEIKIDTFNFTKYGMIEGRVTSISQDAIKRQKPVDPQKDKSVGAVNGSSEPPGQEMVYSARISLDKTEMAVEDKIVRLAPGMAVTAEIKTGSRTILSYLLSPMLRFKQESLRER